jgi:hypothetical protein
MLPPPWMIDQLNRREREREAARWEPIPLQAPTWDGLIHHEDRDIEEDEGVPRSTVIIIDMNDLPDPD